MKPWKTIAPVVLSLVALALGCQPSKDTQAQTSSLGPPAKLDKPFLTIPLKSGTPYQITECWQYSAEERAIHGMETHFAIDFAAAHGTTVLAPCNGIAVASTHIYYLDRLYKGKKVGFGLGRFVQIYHEPTQSFIALAHLGGFAETVAKEAYFDPEHRDDGSFYPQFLHDQANWARRGVPVKRGQVIGTIGVTGLGLGNNETPLLPTKVRESWDEPHVHMEGPYRRDKQGKKVDRTDAFGLYSGDLQAYRDPTPKGLWLRSPSNPKRFCFADEAEAQK